MIRNLLSVAVATGLLVGLVMAAILNFTTTPLILKAEVYEKAAQTTEGKSVRVGEIKPGSLVLSAHAHEGGNSTAAAAHHHEDTGWSPDDGLQRTAATSIATIAVALGYALVLLGCMILARETITPSSGLLWALAGFAAVGLAPALGLAPELPGSAGAELLERQVWWIGSAFATAIGLFLLIRKAQWTAKAAGLALVVAPHLIGAPQPPAFESTAPAELAAAFASTSLVVHALMWILIGLCVGWLWQRTGPALVRGEA